MVRPRPAGFSLTEVLVALVVLEIGLLGVLGLGALAARELARTAELQRATLLLDAVADSLLRVGPEEGAAGERVVGGHVVRWRRGGGTLLVETAPAGAGRPALVAVALPVGP